MATVRNSVLNPLATCFVPSSLKTFYADKTIADVRVAPKGSNTDDSSVARNRKGLNKPASVNFVYLQKQGVHGKRSPKALERRNVKQSSSKFMVDLVRGISKVQGSHESLTEPVLYSNDGIINAQDYHGPLTEPVLYSNEVANAYEPLTEPVLYSNDGIESVQVYHEPLTELVLHSNDGISKASSLPEAESTEIDLHFTEGISLIEMSLEIASTEPLKYHRETWGICSFLLLPLFKLYVDQLSEFNKSTYSKPSEIVVNAESKREEECLCPPMFGWVVPPNFFGNPFNLSYGCCKNYVHAARNFEGEKNELKEKRNEILEQCSWEFQMIIKDVCNSVRDDDLLQEWEDEIKGKPAPCDDSFDSGPSVWNNVSDKVEEEEPVMDDESHPLLQSLENSMGEGGKVPVDIEVVENILEKCLTPKDSQTFDFEVSIPKDVCNPPCSVWCDYVPPEAKETFKNFLKKYRRPNCSVEAAVLTGGKPVYKRSFSADDAPKYVNPTGDLSSSVSEVEARRRLILLRKDPTADFTRSTDVLNGKRRQSSHPDLSKCMLKDGNSSMWGRFDGADSLWQALPDCVPSKEHNQKENSHRKRYEMRRQRSLN